MAGFNFAPQGWAMCDGSLIAIDQNDALFALIGTFYGGDGQTTFALPDLRGRVPIHMGNGFNIGMPGGVEAVTVTGQQIPSHSHPVQASTAAATSSSPSNAVFAEAAIDVYATGNVVASSVTTFTGGNQPHDNMMPFLAVTFIIALFGVFPSQN